MDSKMNTFRLSVWLIVLSMIGAIFVASSLGKIFDFAIFVTTIQNVTSLPNIICRLLAAFVIVAEFLGGGFLFVPKYRFLGLSILIILLSIFITILFGTILAGTEIDCRCFGSWGIHFSNRVELAIDIAMIDLLSMFIIVQLINRCPPIFSRVRLKKNVIVLGTVILVIEAIILTTLGVKHSENQSIRSIMSVIKYLDENNSYHGGKQSHSTFIFMLYYGDFNCPPCLDDFLSLCDSLKKPLQLNHANAVAVIHKDSSVAFLRDSIRILKWSEANSITFPVILGPDSLFKQLHIPKSTVILLDEQNKIVFFHVIPIGEKLRRDILSKMTSIGAASE